MSTVDVAVCTVTYGAAPDVAAFLDAVTGLDPAPAEIVVVDCASRDDTVAVLEREVAARVLPVRVVPLGENLGFAGGMNRAIAETRSAWILSLNADARPAPDYLEALLAAGLRDDSVAAVTGRLTRPSSSDVPATIDACGMFLTPSWRHFDRGSEQPDRGQFGHPAEVFGATGAASLFRRAALEDVAVDGELFDESFHSFREDAELAFRLQERGWRILYTPEARCEHRRTNTPARRARMTKSVNMHSLKNRYLLRAYHQGPLNLLLTLPVTLLRDVGILLYVLLRERSSLEAYRWLWRQRHRIRERRRLLRQRRTAPAWRVDRWFLFEERGA